MKVSKENYKKLMKHLRDWYPSLEMLKLTGVNSNSAFVTMQLGAKLSELSTTTSKAIADDLDKLAQGSRIIWSEGGYDQSNCSLKGYKAKVFITQGQFLLWDGSDLSASGISDAKRDLIRDNIHNMKESSEPIYIYLLLIFRTENLEGNKYWEVKK